MTPPTQSPKPPPYLEGSYLVVELTNLCSLSCQHCSVSEKGHPHHHSTGYFDPKMFDDLLTDLESVGAAFTSLILFWLGEPLIHPEFGYIYRAAVRSAANFGTFKQIEVHTNGTHLDEYKRMVAFNNAPVRQVWHVSLDAISRDLYRAIKGRDRLDTVDENTVAFLAGRQKTGAKWPKVVLQYILSPDSEGEVDQFVSYWSDVCSASGDPAVLVAGHVPTDDTSDAPVIFLRQLDCPTESEQTLANSVFERVVKRYGLEAPKTSLDVSEPVTSPCSGFWKSPVIGWNGSVTTCTRDSDFEHEIGTLKDNTFSEIWWGRLIGQYRKRVESLDYTGLKPCDGCFIPHSINHTELSTAELDLCREWTNG